MRARVDLLVMGVLACVVGCSQAGERKAAQGEEASEDDGFSFPLRTRYGFPGEGRAKAAKATPYSYSSLARLSNEEITRWMGRRSWPAPPVGRVMLCDRLPPGFWSLAPREAALATVELNRSDKHKAAYSLGIADGEAPETGSILYYYDSDESYTARDAYYCIYVGTDESYLAYASTASQGIVGYDYAMDVEQVNLCRLELDPRDARHILQTVWWLDRARTKSRRVRRSLTSMRSTADGNGYFELRLDGAPGIRRKGTWWSGRLTRRFGDDFDEEAFINFADFLVTRALPHRLGKAWLAQVECPSFWHWELGKEKVLRHAEAGRKRVAPLVPGMLEEFSVDGRRVSADIAGVAALIAGQEAMTELAPRMGRVLASLPPVPEYLSRRENLDRERRRIRRTPGWEEDEKLKAKSGRLWDEYWKLLQDTDPRDEALLKLRGRLGTALKKTRIAGDIEALHEVARRPSEIGRWALRVLKSRAPERYLDAVEDWIAYWLKSNSDVGARQTFALLTSESKPRALALARSIPPGEVHPLSMPVFALLSEAGELTRLEARIGVLLDIALAPAPGWELRGKAMKALVPPKDPMRYDDKRIDQALVRLLDPKLGDASINFTLAEACRALARRGRFETFDRIVASIGSSGSVDAQVLSALVMIARKNPRECRPKLLSVARQQLTATTMDINKALSAVWGGDLRELKGRIEELANGAPDEAGGPLASCSMEKPRKVVGRYHRARMIASLWNEEDALTRAKLAVAYSFEVCWRHCYRERDDAYFERMRDELAAAKRSLDDGSLAELEDFLGWYERLRAAPAGETRAEPDLPAASRELAGEPTEPDEPLEFAREALGFVR